MSKPRWYSQPFPPSGSISAEGIKKTLGKPPIPWPAILVREAAQNTWDARLGGQPVRFNLDLATVLPQHVSSWQNLLLEGAPPGDKFPLRKSVRGRDGSPHLIRTLTISDRGAKGLGGPTRADVPRGDAPRDWVSFVLNVGDPPDTVHGGGTYGYGKGVLYQISRAGTILVHTRTVEDGQLQNRLIGICLGESIELPAPGGGLKPYTGRHWWGRVEESYVEPLAGGEAVTMAAALGLPKFYGDESGTDLVIVDPDFGEMEDDQVASYLADSIAWNLWPIMLEDRGSDRLLPAVRVGGVEVRVPKPENTRGLKVFVAAYRRLSAGDRVRNLECHRPKRKLGSLTIEPQLLASFEPPDAAQDLGITRDIHHVCLLRAPELVVKYHPGPPSASTDMAYGAVFRAEEDLDRVFASAEPPTHDDWVYGHLEGEKRTFVRMTFTRLKEQLAEFVKPADTHATSARTPLGAISNYLGSLVAPAGGTGAATAIFARANDRGSRDVSADGHVMDIGTSFGDKRLSDGYGRPTHADSSSPAGGFSGNSGETLANDEPFRGYSSVAGQATRSNLMATARLRGEPYFSDHGGKLVLVQDLVVLGSGRLYAEGIADVKIADGTREQEPPSGAEEPVVIGWRTAGGFVDGRFLDLTNAHSGMELSLLIAPAVDSVTQVGVRNLPGVTDGN